MNKEAVAMKMRPLLLILYMTLLPTWSEAQQAYNNVSGYVCTKDGSPKSCGTYTLYRSPNSADTIRSISKLFNASASAVARLSELNESSSVLEAGNPLYVPLRCECVGERFAAMVKYVILSGDTYEHVANSTFQGLTTWQAIEAANPGQNPNTLAVGQVVHVPLRCACPSAAQRIAGTRFLLSYMIFPEESVTAMCNYFNVSDMDLITANQLSGETQVILAFSTMLIPQKRLRPLSSFTFIEPIPFIGVPPSPGASDGAEPLECQTVYKRRSNAPLYIGVAVGASGLVLAAVLGALLAVSRQREMDGRNHELLKPQDVDLLEKSEFLGMSKSEFLGMSMSEFLGMSKVVEGDKPVVFTYEEIRDATDGFSAECRLQGSVFWGKLHGMVVAIKQMKGNMAQEIKILSQIHHMNVVRLLGVCVNDAEHLFMVFEYAENGSLSDCLHGTVAHPTSSYSHSTDLLSWTMRVHIALDIASGLEYIHNYTSPNFVHKDVKSSNILLDAEWHAKVANFGMARSASSSSPTLTNHITGTQGYMAPEYLEHGLVTTKADVFSFGVVLLELITGEEAIVQGRDQFNGCMLASAVSTIEEDLRNWIDSRLQDVYPLDVAVHVAKLAKKCVETDLELRPAMKDITFSLSNLLTACLEWEATVVRKNQMPGVHSAAR